MRKDGRKTRDKAGLIPLPVAGPRSAFAASGTPKRRVVIAQTTASWRLAPHLAATSCNLPGECAAR